MTGVTALLFDDPCVIFALRRESQPFRRKFRPQQHFPGAPCPACFCGPTWLTVLVLESGVGQERMRAGLEWLLARPVLGNVPYRPRLVLSAGFAGALREDCRVGDILLATEVSDLQGHVWPTTWPAEALSGEWRPPLRRGRLLTVPRLVATPQEKCALGHEYGAWAVDMESGVLAEMCARQGVPFGCVRAISDDVGTALSPQLVSLLSGGRVSPLRALAALTRRPMLAGEFARLARQTRLAAAQLGKALGELLTLTLPWSAALEP